MAPSEWFDEAAGPVVRPYAMTQGRTRPAGTGLDLISIVVTIGAPSARWNVLGPEHVTILAKCRIPLSLAEIASDMDLPVGVVRILLDDLLDHGLISVRRPAPVTQLPNERVIEEVIDGLHAL